MSRTLYWMIPDGLRLAERRARGERWETLGFVEDAPYLARAQPSWLRRLFGRGSASLQLVTPFDERGRDVLGLFDESADLLDGDGDPVQVVRRAVGTVVCLSPREAGDEVVLRDLWVGGKRPRRILDAIHFGLEPQGGPPVAVAFAQSPLVIGPPRPRAVETHLATPGIPLPAAALGQLQDAESGAGVEIREGDEIEVLGLTWDPARCERRFDLAGRTASYREVQAPIRLVIGDAPGLRMVIRVRASQSA